VKESAGSMIALGKKNAGKLPEYTTATEVARVLELDPRTVRKRIGELDPKYVDGNNKYFETKKILMHTLLNGPSQENVELDLSQERAKLCKAQTQKTYIEIEKLSDRYMLVEDVEENIKQKLLKFRQKLLIIPSKIGKSVALETDIDEVKEMLKTTIDEALIELSLGEDNGV
jgi:DNA-binding transcriptional MerR regulator